MVSLLLCRCSSFWSFLLLLPLLLLLSVFAPSDDDVAAVMTAKAAATEAMEESGRGSLFEGYNNLNVVPARKETDTYTEGW